MLTWLGLAGAWLLVAGPLFQAMLELHEYDHVKERITARARNVPRPPRVSPFWLLLPPVYFYLSRRRSDRFFKAVFANLPPEEIREYMVVLDKATGWAMVAGGGILLAAKETMSAAKELGLGRLVGAVISVALVFACAGLSKARLGRSRDAARGHEGAPR